MEGEGSILQKYAPPRQMTDVSILDDLRLLLLSDPQTEYHVPKPPWDR